MNLFSVLKKRSKFNKGFSLVEIVVASVLLSIIAAGIFSVTLSSKKIINRSQGRYVATNVAQTIVESLRQYQGADSWYNQSSPIFYNYTGTGDPHCNPCAGITHYLNDISDTCLGLSSIYQGSDFAVRLNGRWRYTFIAQIGTPDYRAVNVEVNWTEPDI